MPGVHQGTGRTAATRAPASASKREQADTPWLIVAAGLAAACANFLVLVDYLG